MLLEREIYTANEAAELLRVHPHTLLRAIRAGRLKAFKVGGVKSAWRIKAAELERFTQEQNQPQQPQQP